MDLLVGFLTTLFSAFFLTVFIVLLALVVLYFIMKLWRRQEFENDSRENQSNLIYLLIKIPSGNEKKEDAFKSFLETLHRALPNKAYVSLEVIVKQKLLSFSIAINKNYQKLIESQLYAQYPGIEIQISKDHSSGNAHGMVIFESKFKRNSVFPVKTYSELSDSALDTIQAYLARMDSADEFIMQFVLQRVDSHMYNRGIAVILFHLFGNKTQTTKLNQNLFKGKLRFALKSSSPHAALQNLKTIVSLLKQLKGINEITGKLSQSDQTLIKGLSTRSLLETDLWSIDEIATLYHFPYSLPQMSNVSQTTSKKAPPPGILPTENNTKKDDLSLIGETNFRNERIRFGIKRTDRPRHLYVIGKTGSGKSRLLQLLLMSDIQSGQGCCLIDPHGDLADELLTYVPKERIKDVVYINPTDYDFPIGFNPLEPVEDYETRQHLSRFFISIFKKLFTESWNPRMEHLIRYITLALLETPDSNILGISRILSDATFRQRVIQQIKDPVVKNFWTTDFSASNEQFINAAAVPIMNKVGQFISNPMIRNMVGQRENMLDFDLFMNKGKIVIINLSKGKLGEDNTALLGSMFITKIQQAALARAKIKEEDRRDFYFYVDEFQNFATDAFSSILSEARKYRLDLTIAHQYIAQLPEDVKATTFGNVGSIIAFSMGGDDASYLAKEFAPTFSQDDMINLNVREMYIKMSIDGKLSSPFSARTLDITPSKFDYSEQIINKSRLTYGKNRIAVENEIKRWSDSTEVIEDTNRNDDFPEPVI